MSLSKTTYNILLFFVFILGVVAYVVRFTVFKETDESVWKEVLAIVGNILIVGVVVGFFTTVVQIFGLFKEELGKVIYDKKFLANRKDIQEVWLNASKVLFEGKFPQIHGDFFSRMLDYLKNKDVAYYNNYEMYIRLEWLSDGDDLIKTVRTIYFDLIATTKKRQSYTFNTWTTVNPGDTYLADLSVTVNGKTPKEKDISKTSGEDKYGRCEKLKVSLKGSLIYKICITETKTYNINTDYVIGFKAKHITNTVRVQLIHPNDIKAIFIPCGTQLEFEEVNNSEIINENKYNHVLLPKQGFFIALNPTRNKYTKTMAR